MKRLLLCILAISLLLGGCSNLWNGEYHSTRPHEIQSGQDAVGDMSAANYTELCNALEKLVSEGITAGVITVARYNQNQLISDMNRAIQEVRATDPIAAYAVEAIKFDAGTNGGKNAVAVSISYVHDRSEIRKIRRVSDAQEARTVIGEALDTCSSGVVLYFARYEEADFAQMVADYADQSPQTVMEPPVVAVNVYPREGKERVVELKFSYKSSRDALRQMQQKVAQLFTSAELYVHAEATHAEKYALLYAFLMERGEYTVETSLTPSYSLLCHNVGDSKAFAVVYAAMCRQVDIPCHVVTGTRAGEPWYWNLVYDGENYYHVDLLRCSAENGFQMHTDAEMTGYVWDYSAFAK